MADFDDLKTRLEALSNAYVWQAMRPPFLPHHLDDTVDNAVDDYRIQLIEDLRLAGMTVPDVEAEEHWEFLTEDETIDAAHVWLDEQLNKEKQQCAPRTT